MDIEKIFKTGMVLFLLFVIYSTTNQVELPSTVRPEDNTTTHFFGTPKPEPGRLIKYYNYQTRTYVYQDEYVQPVPESQQPGYVKPKPRIKTNPWEEEMIEYIFDNLDELMEEYEMHYED